MGAELHRDLMPTLHRPHRGGGVLGGAGHCEPPCPVRLRGSGWGRCPPALRAVGSPLRRKAAPHHPGGSLSPVEPAAGRPRRSRRDRAVRSGGRLRLAALGWVRCSGQAASRSMRRGRNGSAGGGPLSGVPAGAGPYARGAGTVRRTDGPSVTGSGCCRRRPGSRRRRLGGNKLTSAGCCARWRELDTRCS